ncbi:MAG: TM2 domain-containing protein [Clostridia bacterium]|nr:TM2 domain-containing protein [Clostridia bacterium]
MRFCNRCGAAVKDGDKFCSTCGAACAMEEEKLLCKKCGAEMKSDDNFCRKCGVAKEQNSKVYQAQPAGQRSRLVAGLLGIFVGSLGIHNFYLGKIGIAITQIIVTIITCGLGGIWGFIEGILILCDKINCDGKGNPLGM